MCIQLHTLYIELMVSTYHTNFIHVLYPILPYRQTSFSIFLPPSISLLLPVFILYVKWCPTILLYYSCNNTGTLNHSSYWILFPDNCWILAAVVWTSSGVKPFWLPEAVSHRLTLVTDSSPNAITADHASKVRCFLLNTGKKRVGTELFKTKGKNCWIFSRKPYTGKRQYEII